MLERIGEQLVQHHAQSQRLERREKQIIPGERYAIPLAERGRRHILLEQFAQRGADPFASREQNVRLGHCLNAVVQRQGK